MNFSLEPSTSTFSKAYTHLVYIICVVLAFLARYYDVLFNFKIMGHAKDNVYLLGPTFSKVSSVIKEGEYPIFLPELLGGVQFFDSALFSITYPFYFFRLLDYGIGIESLRLITLVTVFHLFILFANTIILLISLDFNKWTSLLGAFIIILASQTARNTSWIIATAGYAWIPLFLAGCILVFSKSKSKLGVIFLAIGSLGFLAKPAQTAILAILFGFILVFVGLIINRRWIINPIKSLAVSAFFIIGINAVGILLMFFHFGEMMRYAPGGFVVGHGTISKEAYHSNVDINNISEFILTNYIDFGPGHPYIGPIACVFFLAGLFLVFRNWKQVFWPIKCFLFFSLVTFLLSFGDDLGLLDLHYNFPLVNKIREPVRFLFITNIGVCVLVSFAIDYLINLKNTNYRYIITSIIIVLSVLIISLQYDIAFETELWIFISLALLFIFSLMFKYANFKLAFYTTCGALMLLNSVSIPTGKYYANKNIGYNNPKNLSSMNILSKLSQVDKSNEYRTYFDDNILKDGMWSQNAMYFGIRSFCAAITPLPYEQFKAIYHSDNFHEYRSLYGAKWLISNKKTGEKHNEYKVIDENEDYLIYMNENARPRYYSTQNIQQSKLGWNGLRKYLQNKPQSILKSKVFLNSSDFNKVKQKVRRSDKFKSNVKLIKNFHNEKEIIVDQNDSSLFIINEVFSPYWKIKVNGKYSELLQVNANQIAVLLDEGESKIEINYYSSEFYYLNILQKLTYIVLIGFIIKVNFDRIKRKSTL